MATKAELLLQGDTPQALQAKALGMDPSQSPFVRSAAFERELGLAGITGRNLRERPDIPILERGQEQLNLERINQNLAGVSLSGPALERTQAIQQNIADQLETLRAPRFRGGTSPVDQTPRNQERRNLIEERERRIRDFADRQRDLRRDAKRRAAERQQRLSEGDEIRRAEDPQIIQDIRAALQAGRDEERRASQGNLRPTGINQGFGPAPAPGFGFSTPNPLGFHGQVNLQEAQRASQTPQSAFESELLERQAFKGDQFTLSESILRSHHKAVQFAARAAELGDTEEGRRFQGAARQLQTRVKEEAKRLMAFVSGSVSAQNALAGNRLEAETRSRARKLAKDIYGSETRVMPNGLKAWEYIIASADNAAEIEELEKRISRDSRALDKMVLGRQLMRQQ